MIQCQEFVLEAFFSVNKLSHLFGKCPKKFINRTQLSVEVASEALIIKINTDVISAVMDADYN